MKPKNSALALLFQALDPQACADVQLLPCGEFVGRDGRPGNGLTWKLPEARGAALAARLNARHASVQFNLDYEHQTLLSEKNGQPAPASGWCNTFEWRAGVGLFARDVQWTSNAKKMIEGHEYKYISPVIVYDKTTGVVGGVINASLTNIPNLDLNPVAQERVARLNASFSDASFFHQPTEIDPMNDVLKALLKALGLPETDDTTAEQATAAVAALKAQADKATSLSTEIAALKADPTAKPDATQWVPMDKFQELNLEVARLSASRIDSEVDGLLQAARAQGKCSPVVEQVWRDVGKTSIPQLKALIDKTPANPALAGLSQTAGKQTDKPGAQTQASADELAMCKNLGMTLEEFRAGAENTAA